MDDWHLKTAVIVVILAFFTANAGWIEGKYFPVVTEVIVGEPVPTDYGSSNIGGSFRLARPNCEFAGLEWLLVGVNRDTTAPVVFMSGTEERPGGFNEFGPWKVQLTESQLKNKSRAWVYHQCPWRWWKTETPFFP